MQDQAVTKTREESREYALRLDKVERELLSMHLNHGPSQTHSYQPNNMMNSNNGFGITRDIEIKLLQLEERHT